MIRIRPNKDAPAYPVPVHIELQGQGAVDAYMAQATAEATTQEQADELAAKVTAAEVDRLAKEAAAKAEAAKAVPADAPATPARRKGATPLEG